MNATSRRLALANFWVAFSAFLPAVLLGAWQMWRRSPLPAPLPAPGTYYASVTLHGTVMAYVVTTFVAMGFGYAIAGSTLGPSFRGARAAWVGFWICLTGTVMAAAAVLSGRASVLYTFYPPLLATAWYYLGAALLVGGSMVWVVLMGLNMGQWKRENPGKPVPLPLFATVATAFLWAWAASGVVLEIGGILLPRALGWTELIDASLARTLFSVTLHAIVYFWLMPAYIAFYTLLPAAAGGRLYSDMMGRLTFVMFLVFSLPVGLHHLLADPEHGSGFKFLQSALTFLVVLPTLLTVFSISASMEVAGRSRGGRGLLGWIGALPWNEPMVLAGGLALVMLGLGGFGGIVNMSYAMNAMVHNTAWVTAHFHLIFGGAVVMMYFAIAYQLMPSLTGRPLASPRLARVQLWLWFVGMLIVTVPWHVAGLMGQPRRVAAFDYSLPLMRRMGPLVVTSVVGGVVLFASAVLLLVILVRTQLGPRGEPAPIRFAEALNPPRTVVPALNGFAVWNPIVAVLMVVAYGYPIGQFFLLRNHRVPSVEVTAGPSDSAAARRAPDGK